MLEAVRGDIDGYALDFRNGMASKQVRAKQVILAMPFTLLRQIRIDVDLPTRKRAEDPGIHGRRLRIR
ncbi:MAG: hypothetical protein ACOH1L_02370 [Thermomonas sp.]